MTRQHQIEGKIDFFHKGTEKFCNFDMKLFSYSIKIGQTHQKCWHILRRTSVFSLSQPFCLLLYFFHPEENLMIEAAPKGLTVGRFLFKLL